MTDLANGAGGIQIRRLQLTIFECLLYVNMQLAFKYS